MGCASETMVIFRNFSDPTSVCSTLVECSTSIYSIKKSGSGFSLSTFENFILRIMESIF